MRALIITSREFNKRHKSKALEIMDLILSSPYNRYSDGESRSISELWLDDTPGGLNHLFAYKAVNTYGVKLKIITIDPPTRPRFRVTIMNKEAPKVEYIQYPHPHPLPRQANSQVWRNIFANRDEWIIKQVLAPTDESHGMAFFLNSGKDSEVGQAQYFAENFGLHIGTELKPAAEWGLVQSFNIKQVYEDSQPKQLTLL